MLNIFSLFVLTLFSAIIYAQSGIPDPNFGKNGLMRTSLNSHFHANCSAIQEDGKLLVGGYYVKGNTRYPALIRYNTDGVLDEIFNSNFVFHNLNSTIERDDFYITITYHEILDLRIVENNKILLLGKLYQNNSNGPGSGTFNFLMQLDETGKINSNYGDKGKNILPFTNNNKFLDFTNNDLRINHTSWPYIHNTYCNGLATITSRSLDLRNVKFLKNTRVSYSLPLVNSLLLCYYDSTNSKIFPKISQVDLNGIQDTLFGVNGFINSFNAEDRVLFLKNMNNSGFLVAGENELNGVKKYFIQKYNIKGKLDLEFNNSGLVEGILTNNEKLSNIEITNTEDLILQFLSIAGNNSEIRIQKIKRNGIIDLTFGTQGNSRIQNYGKDYISSISYDQDNIFLIGNNDQIERKMIVYHLNSNGQEIMGLPTLFAYGYKLGNTYINSVFHFVNNNKVNLIGSDYFGIYQTRFDSRGRFDFSLNKQGYKYLNIPNSRDLSSVFKLKDNKFLISVRSYNEDLKINYWTSYIVDQEGEILNILGSTGYFSSESKYSNSFLTIFQNEDESIRIFGIEDESYNSIIDNLVEYTFIKNKDKYDFSKKNYYSIPKYFYISKLFLNIDQNLLMYGQQYSSPGSSYNMEFLKILANNQIDSTFGVNGKLNLQYDQTKGDFCIDKDGKIYVSSHTQNIISIERFLENGIPDPTFGRSGLKQFTEGTFVDEVKITILPDNNPLLIVRNYNLSFIKLNYYGDFYYSFGLNGHVTLNLLNRNLSINSISYDHSDNIYCSGVLNSSRDSIYLLKLLGSAISSTQNPSLQSEEIHFYPNPTQDNLHVNSNLKDPISYKIMSLTNSILDQGYLIQGNNTIDLTFIPSGLYLLRTRIGSKKFLKL